MRTDTDTPLISVVIVNYKVADYTKRCIQSIKDAYLSENTEIITVDNASKDNSAEIVKNRYPDVSYIELKKNIGFGKACNVGAQNARGRYILFVNPDVLISKDTLKICSEFMDAHQDIGILGPKIINPDGSLQSGCRRSFPTPLNSLFYFTGLYRIFPKSRRLGEYNFNYMDENHTTEVDAVSGSFIFMRRQLFNTIGGFDESFFMYGEDLDLCIRVKKKGYKVWYLPETQIVHFKGKSSEKVSFKSRKAFYEAMVIFSKKYKDSYGAFFPGWLIQIGIMAQVLFHFGQMLVRSIYVFIIDLIVINILLWFSLTIRFHFSPLPSPYNMNGDALPIIGMHILMSLCFSVVFFFQGMYSYKRYSTGNAFISGFIASALFIASLFFIPSFSFSRLAFASFSILITLALVLWRRILPFMKKELKDRLFTTGKVIVAGGSAVSLRLISEMENDKGASIEGVLWPSSHDMPGQYNGYPVLGSIEDMGKVLHKTKIDLLLIATEVSWYSYLIKALADYNLKHLTVKWVPEEIVAEEERELPEKIPLNDFTV